jgi:prepilin-type processing-associated H-X9-DG protein
MYSQLHKQLPDVPTATALGDSLIELKAATAQSLHCPSDDAEGYGYAMTAKFTGLPKSAGKPDEVLASDTVARHSGKANALYFDGRVALRGSE